MAGFRTHLFGMISIFILIPGFLGPSNQSASFRSQNPPENSRHTGPSSAHYFFRRTIDERPDIHQQTRLTSSLISPTQYSTNTISLMPPCYPGIDSKLDLFQPQSQSQQSQLIAGDDIWTLIKTELRTDLSVWEFNFPPAWFTPKYMKGNQFIRLSFECTTGAALTELLTRYELGATIIYHKEGIKNIFIRDSTGIEYPVQFISTWWLAATIEQGRTGLTLHFLDLAPMLITP